MKSGRWEPVELEVWRGKKEAPGKIRGRTADDKKARKEAKGTGRSAESAGVVVIKTERLPDGRTKVILKDKTTGRVVESIE